MKCSKCGNDFPDERTEFLGVTTCIPCTPQRPRPLGVMVYDAKAGGMMETVDDPAVFAALKTQNDEMVEYL